jgi:siroheme synthase-like protein
MSARRPARAYYPLAVSLAGRRVLVAGGGRVGARKVQRLLDHGADVVVVSPEAKPPIPALAGDGRILWERRRAEPADFDGAALAFVATDDADANAALAAAARERGIPVNRADDPTGCDFILPALAEAGVARVAVLTDGVAPSLAKWAARRIGERIGGEIAAAGELLACVRAEVLALDLPQPRRAEIIEAVTTCGALETAAAGDLARALEQARRMVEAMRRG